MERLKELRINKGLTQAQLAKKAGVGTLTISDLELGKRKAHPATSLKLARALDVEVKDLTDWKAENLRLGVREIEHISEVSELLDEMLSELEDLEPDELKRRIPHIRRAQRLLHSGIQNAVAHAREIHRIETGGAADEEEAPESLRQTALA